MTSPLPPSDVLREIFATQLVQLPNGEQKRTTSGIGPDCAWALYSLILKHRPKTVIEIGMAQGISTLSILCALSQTGGQLISIDPYINWKSGRDAALFGVERAGYAAFHRFIENVSELALPSLLAEGISIQAGYIDGNHDFDHAFVDFYYLDLMLSQGGVLGFNNAGWRSVFRVIQYLRRNRVYKEQDVGLKPDYSARNSLLSLARRIMRTPRQDRYFMKLDPVPQHSSSSE